MREVSSTLAELMTIDCDHVYNVIVDFIRRKVAEEKREGVVLGLSGGIDSAVVAILSVRAVGPKNVYALHLFDRQSDKKFRRHAERVATMLEINFEVRDITASVKTVGAYEPFITRIPPCASLILMGLSAPVSRAIRYVWSRRRRAQEARSVSSTRRTRIERSFNVRHIERRRILEEFAREKNLLLIGAANRSESFVGWFVKDGVDDIPVEVILGLYKTQVRQLARCIGVPDEIIKEPPSPDMLRGVTDESVIGHSYITIDKVAYVIENGLSQDIALNEGINDKEFERIRRLNERSAWKRTNRHEFPVF
jgi:NAD+ synthase